jgi:hypothetical protein
MKTRVSSVGTIEPQQRKAVGDAFRLDQKQQIAHATPSLSIQGVPGEYDHRKFITPIFANMVPVQTGVAGGPVVNTIAVTTDPLQWRDYDPGFYSGMFAPPGEKDSKPYYYTDLATGSGPTHSPDPVAPTRAVITERTTAKVFSVNIIQDRDRHS